MGEGEVGLPTFAGWGRGKTTGSGWVDAPRRHPFDLTSGAYVSDSRAVFQITRMSRRKRREPSTLDFSLRQKFTTSASCFSCDRFRGGSLKFAFPFSKFTRTVLRVTLSMTREKTRSADLGWEVSFELRKPCLVPHFPGNCNCEAFFEKYNYKNYKLNQSM